MKTEHLRQANEETREAWNQNAAFWDERMGEGNDFVEVLIWPATERLLELRPGERVLDIACGNGLTSRRLAAMGAEVVAFDFAEEMIAHALERTIEHADRIEYLVLDATDEAALLALDESRFDAALCNMDYSWPTAFNPKFKMERDKTLMQGHDCCNHRYVDTT